MRTPLNGTAALGLEPGATRSEISQAYRRLARSTHPDVSAEPTAAERFAALTAAYQRALAEAAAPPPVRRVPPRPRPRFDDRIFVAGPVHVIPQPAPSRKDT